MTKYNCVITDRYHKALYGASFENEEKAIDFIQKCKDKDNRTYFFTIEKISQNEDDGDAVCEKTRVFLREKILNNATFIGTTEEDN